MAGLAWVGFSSGLVWFWFSSGEIEWRLHSNITDEATSTARIAIRITQNTTGSITGENGDGKWEWEWDRNLDLCFLEIEGWYECMLYEHTYLRFLAGLNRCSTFDFNLGEQSFRCVSDLEQINFHPHQPRATKNTNQNNKTACVWNAGLFIPIQYVDYTTKTLGPRPQLSEKQQGEERWWDVGMYGGGDGSVKPTKKILKRKEKHRTSWFTVWKCVFCC